MTFLCNGTTCERINRHRQDFQKKFKDNKINTYLYDHLTMSHHRTQNTDPLLVDKINDKSNNPNTTALHPPEQLIFK